MNEEMNNVNESVNEVNEVNDININVSYQNTIKRLIASGCKKITNVRIKNVNYTEKDTYTMVSFSIANPIDGFVSNDNGVTYEKGKTNIIFTSLYAIVGAVKEDENLAWMSNALLNNPQALNLIFNGSNVDILQQEISAGEEYVNPFSTRTDSEPQVFDHDVIINYIIGFKLGKVGERMADKLADKLMGF